MKHEHEHEHEHEHGGNHLYSFGDLDHGKDVEFSEEAKINDDFVGLGKHPFGSGRRYFIYSFF